MLYKQFGAKTIKLFLLLVFSTIMFGSEIFAQQKRLVETVDILGNRRNNDADLLEYIKTRAGDFFDEKQAQADLQSLLKTNLFDPSGTRILFETGPRGGITVIFEVRELPVISELNINGLNEAHKAQLYKLLKKQLDLQAGVPFMPYKLRSAKEIIEKYLLKQGFLLPKIEIAEEVISAISVKITFEVKAKRDVQFIKIN